MEVFKRGTGNGPVEFAVLRIVITCQSVPDVEVEISIRFVINYTPTTSKLGFEVVGVYFLQLV